MFQGYLPEQLEQSDMDEINGLYNELQAHEISSDDIGKSSDLMQLQRLFDTMIDELRSKSRSSKLWLAYSESIEKLKLSKNRGLGYASRGEMGADVKLQQPGISTMRRLHDCT